MHSLQKRFHDFLGQEDLIEKGKKVLLAVSGGLDSMAMAQLFYDAEIPIAVAHCNFHLRGDESDKDEAFVINWAASNGVDCFSKSFEIGQGSIQLEARNVRYAWFWQLLEEHGMDRLATAHHLNDSFETLLLNLVRGTGIKGLQGIRAKSDRLIRPLSFATKEEIRAYADDLKLRWREDSSNSRTDYDRNRVRLEIIPQLESLNPSLVDTYRKTQERMQLTGGLVDRIKDEILKEYFDDQEKRLGLEWIQDSNDLVVLAAILGDYSVNFTTAKEIFEAVGKPGKIFEMGNTLITMDRDALFIDEQSSTGADAIVAIDGPGSYSLKGHRFRVEIVSREEVEYSVGNEAVFLDKLAVGFPLTLRRWREGDSFVPLGMSGSKKISDLLIDEKVPLAKKDQVMVLERNGQICWVPGFRSSEKFKLTPDTAEVVRISRATK